MAKCAACGKFLSSSGAATCTLCPCMFHKVCIGIPDGASLSKNWVCPECKKKIRKTDNTDTPVKGVCGDKSPPTSCVAMSIAQPTSEEVQVRYSPSSPIRGESEYGVLRRELAEYMNEIRNEMAEFRSSLAGIVLRLDGLEQRISSVEQRETTSAIKQVAEMENVVAQLKLELNDRDQEALLTDLDIGCLPEENGENITHIVMVLGSKLGVKLETHDIVYAERVGTKHSSIATGSADVGVRPRRVVVRLARRHLRDELLQAARVRRNITTLDMGLGGLTQRLYINERLTHANRLLFHRVRQECRKRHWRFSWTKRGRIYARQGEGMQAHSIRSDSDLLRVFNISTI
ncbi:hypothetical protein K1T71_009963 [Dendrolimus kikuchii]|uniref:Uncharacterized protein n=1 Tax=Dendrolimus kikuchii TaxID=765133 RepID=A0ACC1CTA5_9NEOP|nr:hypothetical protein K1T71_009963 [Dendrolimus kikuchii]